MVPLVELELGGSTNLIDEDRVIWTAQPSVAGEIRDNKGRIATVAVMGGHKYGTVLPAQGSSVVFAALSVFDGRPPDDPLAVPWTHRAGDADASEMKPGSAAARAAAADDGTPDLSPDQLLELPVLGPIDADDVPGVVQ